MKIVVIGGSGLIGTKLVTSLREHGIDAAAASPKSGVDTVTGHGVSDALAGAQVVIDVTNSPTFEDAGVLAFFETSGHTLVTAETAAGVGHHLVLSIVGVDRNLGSGYMRGKMAQERVVTESRLPYTIVRSTQFFEFMGSLAGEGAPGDTVRLSPATIQPIAADDLVAALAGIALEEPRNGVVEIAGPDRMPLDNAVAQCLAARNDTRTVVADVHALYYGIELNDRSLTPGAAPRIGPTHFSDWLKR
jgi:uncharacterized protein YbjT (DUF2867 family)